MWYEKILETNLLPDFLLRFVIRQLLKYKSRKDPKSLEKKQEYLMNFIDILKQQSIAINTQSPNIQHYELPTPFFKWILGKRMKYSSGLWDNIEYSKKSLDQLNKSEDSMLKLTCQRAEINNGDKILDLGCGWGSFCLYAAEKYRNSEIYALTNSKTQKEYIEKEMKRKGVQNLHVIKEDIGKFEINKKFNRIVSVEMFEHMRNYEKLLGKLSTILEDDGKLFVHIFTRNEVPYMFRNEKNNWMTKYFFIGGTMPSTNLLLYFNKNLRVEKHWKINGKNYQKTLDSWLYQMDSNKDRLLPIIAKTYGNKETKKWWVNWRIFFIANSEVFGFKKGDEWFISHYLLSKRK